MTDNLTALGGTAYSFYLNVIVLEKVHPPLPKSSLPGETEKISDSINPEEKQIIEQQQEKTEELEGKKEEDEQQEGKENQPNDDHSSTDEKKTRSSSFSVILMPKSMSLASAARKSLLAAASSSALAKASSSIGRKSIDESFKKMDKSMQETVKKIDKSMQEKVKKMSDSSRAASTKAAAFLEQKTKSVASRTSSALDKIIPEIIKLTGFEGVTIGKRFQDGPVSVLHVSLKATELPIYIEHVRGEKAAEQYRIALTNLKLLGATESIKSLEKESVPQVRLGLMAKMSELLIKAMNEKDIGFEVDCIALDEAEEAKWLFTFLEFQAQMKNV